MLKKNELISTHKSKIDDIEAKYEEIIKLLTIDLEKKINQKIKENDENLNQKSQEITLIQNEKNKNKKIEKSNFRINEINQDYSKL